eukprot:COSAG05_NODE_13514_length_427_cov_0.789634_1_plen_119_part_10
MAFALACPQQYAQCMHEISCRAQLQSTLTMNSGPPTGNISLLSALLQCDMASDEPSAQGGDCESVFLTDSGSLSRTRYTHGEDCRWSLTCSDTSHAPVVSFSYMDLKPDWDFLNIFDGD